MSIKDNAKQFWNLFVELEDEIVDGLTHSNYEILNKDVEKLDDMCYEMTGCHFFVENVYGELECTFDTGPNKTCQLIAQYFVQVAPKSISNHWILNDCLPPLSSKAVLATVQIKEDQYNLQDFFVSYGIDDNQDLVHVKVYCPGFYLIDNTENKKEMSMYLLELALGQCCYEAYISHIDYMDECKEVEEFCPLIEFYDRLLDIVERKGWHTYASPLDIYSVYQPIQDFAHDSLRKDMKMIFTTHPILLEETIEEKNDVLSDMESKGGKYGYIYYSNLYGNQQDALLHKEISNSIQKQLQKNEAGKVIGGSIGKSYSYIDCAIFDESIFNLVFGKIKRQLDDKVELYYQSF